MSPEGGGSLAVLHRLRQPAETVRPGERCELCATPIGERHGHVVDLERRALRCACRPCALLFTRPGAAGGRFRTVPERVLRVATFVLSPGQWDDLQIPVNLAFFFHDSAVGEVAGFYPSPAGATQSLLPLAAWAAVVAANPVLAGAEPDVEAVLLRADPAGPECFIVPIDACYELVGRLRALWRGFDGGQDVHRSVADFLDDLRRRATVVDRG